LKAFEERIKKITSVDTLSIRSTVDKSEVTLAGMVGSLKEINTKKGDRMAFVTLEDLKGYLEVIVFADLYKNVQHLLHLDEPLLIRGQVDFNEDQVKLLATQIALLKKEDSTPQNLHVRVLAEALNENKLKTFRLILSRYPGGSPVYLHLVSREQKETVLKLPRELDAQWNSELEQELTTLLGTHSQIRYGALSMGSS